MNIVISHHVVATTNVNTYQRDFDYATNNATRFQSFNISPSPRARSRANSRFCVPAQPQVPFRSRFKHYPKRTPNLDAERESPHRPKTAELAFWVDRLPILTAAIGPLSIMFSLFYEWGFLAALGFRFVESPTTLADHLGSWLEWLPWIAITLIFVISWELLSQRIERGMTEEEIIRTSQDPTRTRKLRTGYKTIYKFLGPLILINYLALGDWIPLSSVAVGFAFTWFTLTAFVFGIPRMTDRYSLFLRRCFLFIPIGMSVFFYLGYQEAERRVTNSEFHYRIYYMNKDNSEGFEELQLLRTFEKWLVVRNHSNKINWIAMKNVARIEFQDDREKFGGLLCKFSERLCWKNLKK